MREVVFVRSVRRAVWCVVLLASVGAALAPGNAASPSVVPERKLSFSEPQRLRVAKHPNAVAVGDLNGDRLPDLVTASTDGTSNNVSVLLNRGHGHFDSARTYRVGLFALSVAIGDLNGDGSVDVASSNLIANSVSVLLNNGDGHFLPRVDYASGGHPADIAIGDLN